MINDIHSKAFKEEAYELLSELENSLLELEEIPDDQEIIGRVFRAMHTIKGSGAMFGFDDIAGFTHEVETVFDLVRNGKMNVSRELVDLTLSARDHIREMLDEGGKGNQIRGEELIRSFRELIPSATEEEEETLSSPEPISAIKEIRDKSDDRTYRIQFLPHADLFMNGTNPLGLLNELREMGSCKVVAKTGKIPPLQDIDPQSCYLHWDIILTTNKSVNDIKDVFIFVEDSCKLNVDVIDDSTIIEEREEYKKTGEILVERGVLKPEDLRSALEEKPRIGQMLVEKGLVSGEEVQSALIEQQTVRELRSKRQQDTTASSVRVPSDRLDKLVDLVGELVIVQARLSQTAGKETRGDLISIAEEVEHLTSELQDSILSLRMLPIGTTFSKFRRLVRDLSHELGKDIEMTTDGAETELDKTVIEKLNDPLVHLIRNSIDHGIEDPQERVAQGKPRTGTVHLSAVHSGANILISIKDDGKGLDEKRIREKAVDKGLISADANLSQKEIFDLIFLPGFSTAQNVTNVSGRGVGMDVVKRSIESLRGSINVSSKLGKGTTIVIKLPLTLAIIEGLLVQIGKEFFVLPLSVVEECVELSREDVKKAHGRHIANVRGTIVPYIRLRDNFSINGGVPDIEQIVISSLDGKRVGLVVDNVIGGHQTVIKSMGRVYKDLKGISGATILGDGNVALILDIPQIIQDAEAEERI